MKRKQYENLEYCIYLNPQQKKNLTRKVWFMTFGFKKRHIMVDSLLNIDTLYTMQNIWLDVIDILKILR